MMSNKKSSSSRGERPVSDAVRKPMPPPGHPLSHARPEERAHPAERKAKHKHRPEEEKEEEKD